MGNYFWKISSNLCKALADFVTRDYGHILYVYFVDVIPVHTPTGT